MGKLLLLTLNEQEETAVDKIIAAIADCISLEAIQTISVPASGMAFPGLEIRQSQRRVFQGGEEVNLTRLESILPALPSDIRTFPLESHPKKKSYPEIFAPYSITISVRGE